MKNNMFIFLTKSGSVFNRTNGKNERLYFDKEYNAVNGILIFSRERGNSKVTVTRKSLSVTSFTRKNYHNLECIS